MISLTAFNMIKAGAETNTRVFTPQKIVKEMLDALPPEVWNSKTTFLDPAVKSGVYLVEIYNRLMETPELIKDFPDEQDRAIHIYKNQLFGIAIDNFCCLMTQRNLYGHIGGESNIRLIDGYMDLVKNKDSRFYTEAVKKEFNNMKFDVIIGNPPYQEMTGGGRNENGATPVYDKFISKAQKISDRYISMIIPAKWFTGGRGLNAFREEMLTCNKITYMVDYPNSTDVFEDIDLAGGVCYFLMDVKHNGDCNFTSIINGSKNTKRRKLLEDGCDIFIRSNEAVEIYKKVSMKTKLKFDSLMHVAGAFKIDSYVDSYVNPHNENMVYMYDYSNAGYINRNEVCENTELLSKYKVFISKAYGERGNGPFFITGKPFLGEPNTCCSISYLTIGGYASKNICENIINYIKTRFFRFLVGIKKNTQNGNLGVYELVPLQDFTNQSDIDWSQSISDIDKQLYKKYNLTDEEIDYIEKTIKPMT